jgi:hypothetical protein
MAPANKNDSQTAAPATSPAGAEQGKNSGADHRAHANERGLPHGERGCAAVVDSHACSALPTTSTSRVSLHRPASPLSPGLIAGGSSPEI